MEGGGAGKSGPPDAGPANRLCTVGKNARKRMLFRSKFFRDHELIPLLSGDLLRDWKDHKLLCPVYGLVMRAEKDAEGISQLLVDQEHVPF